MVKKVLMFLMRVFVGEDWREKYEKEKAGFDAKLAEVEERARKTVEKEKIRLRDEFDRKLEYRVKKLKEEAAGGYATKNIPISEKLRRKLGINL